MLAYRLSKSKYAEDMEGTGAREKGGRWNSKGVPVIYTSDSPALAILEYLANIDYDLVPKKLSIITLEIPDKLNIKYINVKDLPKRWQTYPAPVKLAKIGDKWVEDNKSAILGIPSVHIPENTGGNYILNPGHVDFKKIKIKDIRPYSFDHRLTT